MRDVVVPRFAAAVRSTTSRSGGSTESTAHEEWTGSIGARAQLAALLILRRLLFLGAERVWEVRPGQVCDEGQINFLVLQVGRFVPQVPERILRLRLETAASADEVILQAERESAEQTEIDDASRFRGNAQRATDERFRVRSRSMAREADLARHQQQERAALDRVQR